MPYDRRNSADRAKVARRLKSYFRDEARIPSRAVDQFAEVYNSVWNATEDEGHAQAAGLSMVRKRYAPEAGGAYPRMAVATVGKALAASVGRKALHELERVIQHCDCGKDHAKALAAVQLALRVTNRAIGNPAPGAAGSHAKMEMASAVDDSAFEGVPTEQVGTNSWAVWTLFATQIYGTNDRVFLAVREMLQNSRDAGAKNISVRVENEDANGDFVTLTFEDDGRGMSLETVRKKFLVFGESEKGADALGGFGAAKAAILTASTTWNWELRTRDVLVRSRNEGSFQAVQVGEFFPGTRITLRNVAGGEVRTPMSYGLPAARVVNLFALSDMRGIKVTVNGATVEGYFEGRRGKNETGWSEQHWGRAVTCTVKSYRRESGSGGVVITRVKGLAQFAEIPGNEEDVDRDWVLDFEIDPSVKPKDFNYPFSAGRDRFNYSSPARRTYEALIQVLTRRATGGGKELSDYEEILPDSTDPRERAAEQKFAAMLDEVMTSTKFEDVMNDLADLVGVVSDAVNTAVSEGRASVTKTDAELQQEEEQRQLEESSKPSGQVEAPAIEPTTEFEQQVNAFVAMNSWLELMDYLRDWAAGILADETEVRWLDGAWSRLDHHMGLADDLSKVVAVLKRALEKSSPGLSKFVIAGVISRLIGYLERGVRAADQEEVERRKKRGDLNPFGGAAMIMISRANYGPERGKVFRRNAKKYMRHLAAWDFTLRAVIKGLPAGQLSDITPGFVLDDTAMGLCAKGHYVMINPEMLDKVATKFKDRPDIVASFIHGVACHELAHAYQMQTRSDADHNEKWAIRREWTAADTLFLLPTIEEGVARLLKLKRRRRAKRADPAKADVEALQRVADLEAALADMRVRAEMAEGAVLALDKKASKADAEVTLFKTRASGLLSDLDALVTVAEFRDMVKNNPGMLANSGITVEQFFTVIDSPGGVMSLLEYVRRSEDEARTDAMEHAGMYLRREANEGRKAAYAACGCGGSWLAPIPEKQKRNRDYAKLSAQFYGGAGRVDLLPGYQRDALQALVSGHAALRTPKACGPLTGPGLCPPAKGYVTVGRTTGGSDKNQTKSDESEWARVAAAAIPILSKYNVSLGNFIGCGSFGCAYKIEGDSSRVVKITGDPSDAAAWQNVINAVGRGEWPEGIARVECVEALPKQTRSGRRLFVMIQEALKPLPKGLVEWLNDDDVSDAILDRNAEEAVYLIDEKGLSAKEEHAEVVAEVLVRALNWLKAHKIKWHDLHGGNVMLQPWHDGSYRPVIMDLGFGQVPTTKIAQMVDGELPTRKRRARARRATTAASRLPSKRSAHLIAYTGEALEEEGQSYYVQQAKKLVKTTRWPSFQDIVAICLDEEDKDDPTLVGVVGMNHGELLFYTVEDYRGSGVATLMVEAMLETDIEGATLEEVLDGGWMQPYGAVVGSEEGADLLRSLEDRFGWRMWALIDWTGYNESQMEYRRIHGAGE